MTFDDVMVSLKGDLAQVETEILRHLHTEIPLLNELAQYIFDSGGKRLRPAILVLASRMFTAPGAAAHQAAASLEYLHTATLLHDDVVDDAAERRSKVAARMVWGNAASVLVGDYLLATSFSTLTELGNLDVLATVSETTSMMAKGEILQLIRRFDTATEQDYMAIIIHKTACLFAAAAKVGGAFGGANTAQQKALYEYGNALGIAFQMVDDALDYASERARVGKPLGTDLKEKKLTLPLSRLLDVAPPEEKAQVVAILEQDAITDENVKTVVEMMESHQVPAYTVGEAKRWAQKAVEALASLPDGLEKDQLDLVARFVVDRDF